MAHTIFDVVVIGAGPAGMLAAGTSSAKGMKTALLEKNDIPGKKLRLTGGGRCNVTTLVSQDDFLKAFGHDGQFLRQAINAFGPEELKLFLSEIGVETYRQGDQLFVHGGGRKLVDSLVKYLHHQGVRIFFNERAAHVRQNIEDNSLEILTQTGKYIAKQKLIITTGGKTYPLTGSEGDGLKIAEELGLKIQPTIPAMGAIALSDNIFIGLSGISLDSVSIEVFLDGKRNGKFRGGLVITHNGLSGPSSLNASLAIARGRQKTHSARIRLDFFPDENERNIDLLDRLPQRLREMLLKRAGVDTKVKSFQLTRLQRRAVQEMLTGIDLEVANTGTFENAMVTVGGVSLKEIDPRTMESRRVKNVYFAGEILDLAGACGGFNIQAAFSTGYLAGIS
jgi:predicted Rossmann fold flavoprotein